MLIVLAAYGAALYLVFGVFKILKWNKFWASLSSLGGLIIALVVIGALNYKTPSGAISIQGATVEITPNVAGTVVEAPIGESQSVEAGDLLFRLDDTPFVAEVRRLEAALIDAQSSEALLTAELNTAAADVQRLLAQLDFGVQRRDDIIQLANRGATAEFQLQEAVSNIEQLQASLDAARARKNAVEIRIASEIGGENASVVQAQQALEAARWNLEQTRVVAPSDGELTAVSLRVGQRVTALRPAMIFIPSEQRAIVGVFKQNGLHAFKIGAEVEVALRALPGTKFTTVVEALVPGTSDGTLSGATGNLPSVGNLLGGDRFAVRLALPEDLPDHALKIGNSGTATMFTEDAGAIEALARIILWIKMQVNYL